MAIKAKEQITVVDVTDIDHVAKYYLMQSSTLSKPAKPTVLPPGGGWAITEPAYTDGSTNSLYTVELTVWSNDTYDYSDVSLSSSFEAAKSAYNKANAAQDSAEDAKAAITVSATPPASPVVGQLWQAETGQPIKRWSGTSWVVHYISVDNLNVKELSAITANLGTVTAGTIKSANGAMIFDVTNGTLINRDPQNSHKEFAIMAGGFELAGKDQYTNNVKLKMTCSGLHFSRLDNTSIPMVHVEFDTDNGQGGDVLINGTPILNSISGLKCKEIAKASLIGSGNIIDLSRLIKSSSLLLVKLGVTSFDSYVSTCVIPVKASTDFYVSSFWNTTAFASVKCYWNSSTKKLNINEMAFGTNWTGVHLYLTFYGVA